MDGNYSPSDGIWRTYWPIGNTPGTCAIFPDTSVSMRGPQPRGSLLRGCKIFLGVANLTSFLIFFSWKTWKILTWSDYFPLPAVWRSVCLLVFIPIQHHRSMFHTCFTWQLQRMNKWVKSAAVMAFVMENLQSPKPGWHNVQSEHQKYTKILHFSSEKWLLILYLKHLFVNACSAWKVCSYIQYVLYYTQRLMKPADSQQIEMSFVTPNWQIWHRKKENKIVNLLLLCGTTRQ